MNITFDEATDMSGMTNAQLGALVGLGKAAISRVRACDYPNWQSIQKAIIAKLGEAGYLGDDYAPEDAPENAPKVDPLAFISTQNVRSVNSLCDDLLDPDTSLNASIGMITGAAGYGKTTALQHYVGTHELSAYVLYMEGYTLVGLCRAIAFELLGAEGRSYAVNLALIERATATMRKLIIIDEADRMPVRFLEALRNINEKCGVPIVLAGEESLVGKMASLTRLRSRIRKPEIVFKPLTTVDVATFYQTAVGIDISNQENVCRTLWRWSGKDFRTLVNDAQHLCKIMANYGISEITEEVLNAYKPHRA